MNEILSCEFAVFIIEDFVPEQFIFVLTGGNVGFDHDLQVFRINFVLLVVLAAKQTTDLRLVNGYLYIVDGFFCDN